MATSTSTVSSTLPTLSAGAAIVPAKMCEYVQYFGLQQSLGGMTGAALGAAGATATYSSIGDRPCVAFRSTAATKGYQAQFSTASNEPIKLYPGKEVIITCAYRATNYTQSAFGFGLGTRDADLYTNAIAASGLANICAVVKAAAGTVPKLRTEAGGGGEQDTSFNQSAGQNDTWYEFRLVITADSTTANKGVVQYSVLSAPAAGDAFTMESLTVNTQLPSAAMSPFVVFYDPTGDTTGYFDHISISINR